MSAKRLRFLQQAIIGVALAFASPAHATPPTLFTATNCVATSMSSAEWEMGGTALTSCVTLSPAAPSGYPTQLDSVIDFTCDAGPLEVWFSTPASARGSLWATQVNNSLNLGKKFKAISYTAYTYTAITPASDVCQSVFSAYGLPATGTANALFTFKI